MQLSHIILELVTNPPRPRKDLTGLLKPQQRPGRAGGGQ